MLLLEKVRHWLRTASDSTRFGVRYEVACACGALLEGSRRTKYQAPRCPACGRKVFILPLSPFGPVRPPPPSSSSQLRPPQAIRRRRWLFAALAGVLGVAALVVVGVWLLEGNPLEWRRPVTPRADLETVQFHIGMGRRHLDEGEFQSAAQELERARLLRPGLPAPLPPAENRDLSQLHRQASLLADLLTESLEEILHRLNGLPDREVQVAFERQHRGKSVVFYTRVHRDATGRFDMDYRVLDEGREARLEIGDLKLLQDLPLRGPTLVLFGSRLAGVRRLPNGGWVILLDSASGVLITHPGAAASCCFQPPDRDQLQEVVQRQAQWAAELP